MQYSFDEAKAKAALEKVKDKPASLTFLYSDNDPNWEPIALSTQASLGKIGINVKLEKLANATMRDRVGKAITTLPSATGARTLPTRTCS
jgi:peptide/nickel transport system substrate-binding protein